MAIESGTSRLSSGGDVVMDEPAGGRHAGHTVADARRMRRVRWLIWLVLASCYLVVYFHRVAPGVVADRLMADFSASGAEVGLLAAIYFYVYAAMRVPSGALADTLGVRRTVAIAAALSGLGSIVFALAPSLEVAYFGRFLVGLGVSVVFVAAMKFQAYWFHAAEFGTVSGLLLVAGNVGGVIATTPVALAAQALGWRVSFAVIGAGGCALAFAAWRWVRDHPSDLGLPSPSDLDASSGHLGVAPKVPAIARPSLAGAGIVWRNRQTWVGLLAHFGIVGAYMTFIGLWAVPYLMHVYGMNRPEASSYLLATSLGLLVSGLVAGRVSDRLQRRKLPILALGMLAVGVWATMTFWGAGEPPVWSLYPLFTALGLSAGNAVLILAAVKEANPPALAGLAMGTANSAFLCAALLQPAMGYVLDGYWQGEMLAGARIYPLAGYQVVLAVLGVFALAGCLGAWAMKETRCRDQAEL